MLPCRSPSTFLLTFPILRRTQSPRRITHLPAPLQPRQPTLNHTHFPDALQELYKNIAWPLYRIFGHAFDAFKVTVSDEGEAIFNRLVEDRGAPIEVLTPEVRPGYRGACVWRTGAPCRGADAKGSEEEGGRALAVFG